MSSRNGAPIDFQAWAQNQIVKRTEAALKERDAAFAERHAETPLPQLARYLNAAPSHWATARLQTK